MAERYGGGATVEIAPDVFAIGGWVDLGPDVSWVPPGTSGVDPSWAYLLRDPSQSLLIDTGLRVHREEVLRRLRELLPAGARLSVVLTRHEPDCFGNLGAVMRDLAAERVYGFGQNSIEFFFPEELRLPRPPADYFELMRLGDELSIGGRRLVLLPAAMGSLRTSWPFDPASGILFCSDLFNWHHLARPDDPWVLDEPIAATDTETVAAHLIAKFEWLPYQQNERLRRALRRVFDSRTVTTLAPAHGCIVRGSAAVAREVEALGAAVDRIAARAEQSA